tara:strand:+ start:3997 stop:4119 length:123 start_codon:yes stop_codon:yes gene_type:complete
MKNKKMMFIAIGSVLAIGLGYFAYSTYKKNKEQKELEKSS